MRRKEEQSKLPFWKRWFSSGDSPGDSREYSSDDSGYSSDEDDITNVADKEVVSNDKLIKTIFAGVSANFLEKMLTNSGLSDEKLSPHLNYRNKDGWTPLLMALKVKNYQIASLLIKHGAKIERKEEFVVVAKILRANDGKRFNKLNDGIVTQLKLVLDNFKKTYESIESYNSIEEKLSSASCLRDVSASINTSSGVWYDLYHQESGSCGLSWQADNTFNIESETGELSL